MRRRRFIASSAGAVAWTMSGTTARAAAATPPMLDVPLRIVAGVPATIGLRTRDGEGWTDANIGRVIVRAAESQTTVAVRPDTKDRIAFEVAKPGPALFVASVGPSRYANRPDAWQRATLTAKAFIRVAGPDGIVPAGPDAGTTGKVGLPTELLPLISPFALRVGDVLPIRAYVRTAKRRGAKLNVVAPDGPRPLAITDAVGTSTLAIDAPGVWLVDLSLREGGLWHAAQLLFEVPA